MNQTRAEEYRSPLWQKKRLEILEKREWKCEDCGEKQKQLHVHHTYYVPTRAPWNYPDFAYVVVCDSCHEKRHGLRERDDRDEATGEVRRYEWEVFLEELGPQLKIGPFMDLAREAYLVNAAQGRPVVTLFISALLEERKRLGQDVELTNAPWYPDYCETIP